MKILYISDRQAGGIAQHVQCLTDCLPGDVERYVIGVGGDEPFAGKNGHDIREWFQIRRVIKAFKPDIVHFHTNPLMMELYVRFAAKLPRVCSIHTPSRLKVAFSRWLVNWAVMPCYWLPVSAANWKIFKQRYPHAQGEVFFNPIKLSGFTSSTSKLLNSSTSSHLTLGMVGRNAAQKDWPAFHAVVECIQRDEKLGSSFAKATADRGGSSFAKATEDRGGQRKINVLNAGEEGFCDGRAAIAQMDLFIMTSKHEEMPTVVLECFMARTPICGFIPEGGMEDILALSNGALREVFIAERDPEKLAKIAERVLDDGELRSRIVEDGWQILTRHFDAKKNVKGQLMGIYQKVIDNA